MAEKKHSAFALLEILTRYSDENHILSTKKIQELLLQEYQLSLERRTLYSNFDILEQAGYEINRYEDNGKGYFLEEKQFTKAEILLMCNAIHSSHFLSHKQSQQLIKKLLLTQSKFEAKEFQGKVYLPNSQKTENTELMYTISLVSEAIRDQKKIQFQYCSYGLDKKLHAKRERVHSVEPRYIVYAESRPYLIATNPKYDDFIHYRLDRIQKATLCEEPSRKMVNEKEAYEYAKNKLFMFAGNLETVVFLCKEKIIDAMIDLFGVDVFISKAENNQFLLRVKSSYQGAKYLAQQYLDSLEILEPKKLRDEFLKELSLALERYQQN